ncbi:hypothetical protein ACIBJC_17335 [Streptomyces sp. NPDC050509]|uniref:hypothetical protein n=1 Tax=Streptomyces sp. NPDC050509 TaxID=3365620 RepID=UPI0037B58964
MAIAMNQNGLIVLPPGAQQMWKNEYFHLDCEVTLHLNETEADYNLDILPLSWDAVSADLTTPPDGGQDGPRSRYGLVRDTGRERGAGAAVSDPGQARGSADRAAGLGPPLTGARTPEPSPYACPNRARTETRTELVRKRVRAPEGNPARTPAHPHEAGVRAATMTAPP